MDFGSWIKKIESTVNRRVSEDELKAIEALEQGIEDDPEFVMLKGIADGVKPFNIAQGFHRISRGSGLATLRLLLQENRLRYMGRGNVTLTRTGKAFLSELA